MSSLPIANLPTASLGFWCLVYVRVHVHVRVCVRVCVRVPPTQNPKGELILSLPTDAKGQFAFTSHVPGEHQVCLSTTNSHWFGEARKLVRRAVKLSSREALAL